MATIRSIINGFLGLKKDPTATTQDVAVIKAEDTNAGIVLKPNGTGAIMAQVPDGTATGGNARGQYAVDLQMIRGVNTQIAGNRAVIVGGSSNTASGTQSVVVGGQNNIADKLQSFIGGGNGNTIAGGLGENAIVGGTLNTNSGTYGFIGAGFQNTVSQSYGVISGGQSNTASTNTHATVVGGYQNTSSGQYSVSGGWNNVASGSRAIAFGVNSVASGTDSFSIGYYSSSPGSYSVALGKLASASGIGAVAISAGAGNITSATGRSAVSIGNDTLASGENSFCTGYFSRSYLYGQKAHSGSFVGSAIQGNCQISELNPFKEATLASAATTVLSLDGTGTTNLIIPNGNNRAWNVTVKWVAVITADGGAAGITVGDSIASTEQLLFKKVGGVSSVVGTASTISTHSDASMASCSMAYTAGASQELALTFTGPTFASGGPVTCRVVAKIELTEVGA